LVGNAECSWENPLSIEAKSPRPTAHTRHQTTRNNFPLSETLNNARQVSRSDLVLEPFSTELVVSLTGQIDRYMTVNNDPFQTSAPLM
jgi:hypothetical protein